MVIITFKDEDYICKNCGHPNCKHSEIKSIKKQWEGWVIGYICHKCKNYRGCYVETNDNIVKGQDNFVIMDLYNETAFQRKCTDGTPD